MWRITSAILCVIVVVALTIPVIGTTLAQATWSPMTSGTTSFLNGVWGTSSSDVFAVGAGGTIIHYDGATWSPMVSGTTVELTHVWGSSTSDVFAVGAASYHDGIILHYDGAAWSTMAEPPEGLEGLYGVWGSSSTNVYAVGMARSVYQYDGATWSVVDTGTNEGDDFYAVWGTSPSDVFVVGHYWLYTGASVVHFDGVSWTRTYLQSIGASTLKGVWGSSSTDVFAVGHEPTLLHYDGVSWSTMDPGITNEHLWGIWGTSSTDVFAVGTRGKIIHYDGVSWSLMTSGTTRKLAGVWGTSSTDVFAVGEAGTILRYAEPPPTPEPDLVVSGLSAECAGDCTTYTVTFTICNQGDADTGVGSVAGVYVDGSWQEDQAVGALNAGQCTDPITAGPFTLSDDTDTIEVRADDDGDVEESNEGNNIAQTSMPPGGCFIATSACGPDDANVETLRSFRDSRLTTDSLGSGFVSAYYRLSPPVAEFIDDHPALKPGVRALLLPAVGVGVATLEMPLLWKVILVILMLAASSVMLVKMCRTVVVDRT
jgi:hypothetical protein